jgi:AcrR family transcriptional regulator
MMWAMVDSADRESWPADEGSLLDTVRPRNLHQHRSAESSRLMLEAAAKLIVEVGYHKMTLAAIGEQAGYSRGLATMRFGSKAALVQKLVEFTTTGWYDRRALSRAAEICGYDAAVLLLDGISQQAADDPARIRTVYSLMFEALGPHPELREYFVAFHRQLHSDVHVVIARGIRDGSIDHSLDPHLEADFIIANLRGVAYLWALDPDQFDPVASFAQIREVVASWLAPRLG